MSRGLGDVYKRQILAGQCNDDIDVVRGKIFKLCEAMGEDVHSFMEQIHDELYGIE